MSLNFLVLLILRRIRVVVDQRDSVLAPYLAINAFCGQFSTAVPVDEFLSKRKVIFGLP